MSEFRREVERRLRHTRLRASHADVVDELTQHLEDRYAELRSRGHSDAAARAAVLTELEDEHSLPAQLAASGRRDRPTPPAPGGGSAGLLGGVASDFRYAGRVLARSPVFTLAAALLIALGVGANTAIFTVVNAVLLRPLPGAADPDRLAVVYTSDYSGPRFGASSLPDVEALRESGAFAGVAAYAPRLFTAAAEATPFPVMGEVVSADYFEVLGVRPLLGRFFSPDEGGPPGSAPVAVVSHAFWQVRLGGASDAVGSSVRVNQQVLTIIGVAPPSFRGMVRGLRMDVWVPLGAPAALGDREAPARGSRGFRVVARLPPGAALETVQARLDVVAARLFSQYRESWIDLQGQPRVLTVLPESQARVPPQMRGPILGFFALLMGVVAAVLLIACTNVANLMLSRAVARQAELGIRVALGATRGRIARQLLIESVTLAALGGVLGTALAFALVGALQWLPLPAGAPTELDVVIDLRVLLFAAVLTVGTGVLFGLAPAAQAGRAPAPLLRGAGAARPRMRLRNALVVVQVAASMVLLAAGGLFLRTLLEAQRVDTGMRVDDMLLVPFQLGMQGYSPAEAQLLYDELESRLRGLPGVEAVTFARLVPLGAAYGRRFVAVQGYSPAAGEDMEIPFNAVGPGYFEALGIRMARGRGFTRADRDGAQLVVVVNESFARRFWPGSETLGQRVSLNGAEGPYAEVVGVVPDAKYRTLTDPPMPYFYYPYLQEPLTDLTLHVRTRVPPAQLVPALRQAIAEAAPALAPPQITTLRQHVGYATLPQRIAAGVLSVLGAVGLLIAGVGLYGLVAYAVVQRTRELGIRAALGASVRDVQWLVLRQGLWLATLGIVVGLLLSLGVAQAVRGMLLVSPADPLALLGGGFALGATALLASWLPARRAARLDPLHALREG